MKRFSLALLLALLAAQVSAQVLYKYTDANGKITYSDRAPKVGEKAERITADTTTNVINSPAGVRGGATVNGKEVSADPSVRAKERAALRDKLKAAVDDAQANLDSAKKALDSGQAPLDGEQRIVVKNTTIKGKDGNPINVPTGQNAVLRNDAYSERIASLEAAVKAAEEKLEQAQTNYRRGAPD